MILPHECSSLVSRIMRTCTEFCTASTRTMQRIWVNKKQTFAVAVVLVIMYLLLCPRKYDYSDSVVIPKIHASDAWEFVADFSNMKYLNPTIVDFNILSESGNYEHWKYSVEYTENLSHWPYLSNFAVAEFAVKAIPKQDFYYILSNHKTCLFLGLICLDSTSEFKFSKNPLSAGALCEEHVQYECSPVMSGFCKREVEFQRTAIMSNLKNHFVYKN